VATLLVWHRYEWMIFETAPLSSLYCLHLAGLLAI